MKIDCSEVKLPNGTIKIGQLSRQGDINMLTRKLKSEEIALITWMIKDTDEGSSIIDTLEELIIEEMEEGEMGSLRVVVDEEDNRLFSRELAKVDLFDADQVPVFISVNLDTDRHFFELGGF